MPRKPKNNEKPEGEQENQDTEPADLDAEAANEDLDAENQDPAGSEDTQETTEDTENQDQSNSSSEEKDKEASEPSEAETPGLSKEQEKALEKALPDVYPYPAMTFKLESWKVDKTFIMGYKAKSGDIAISASGKTKAQATKNLIDAMAAKNLLSKGTK